MKLFIILSVVACNYAAKLDRTYLPLSGAETAGGSPGSLAAPGQSGQGPFGPQGSTAPGFGRSTYQGSNALNQRHEESFPANKQSASNEFGNQRGQTAQSPNSFGQSASQNNHDQYTGPSNQDFAESPTYSQPERAQAAQDRSAEILRYDNEIDGDNFAYSFETSNGISGKENGVASNGVQAQGAFSYTGDDGQLYSITYTADENGYQPHGDHLPTPPPIPDAILKSIEENARAAAAGTQEGAYQEDYDNEQYNANHAGSPQQYSQGGQDYNTQQQSEKPNNQYSAPNTQGLLEQRQNQHDGIPFTPSIQSGLTQQQRGKPNSQYSATSTQGSFEQKQNLHHGGFPSTSVIPSGPAQQQISKSNNQYGAPNAPSSLNYDFETSSNQAPAPSQVSGTNSPSYNAPAQRPSTQFNADTGYQYNRPAAHGIDSQSSQSTSSSLHLPQSSRHGSPAPQQPAFGRPSGSTAVQQPAFRRPSGSTAVQEPAFERPSGSTAVQQPAFGRPSGSTAVQQPAFGRPSGSTAVQQPAFGRPSGSTTVQQPAFGRPSGYTAVQQPAFGRPSGFNAVQQSAFGRPSGATATQQPDFGGAAPATKQSSHPSGSSQQPEFGSSAGPNQRSQINSEQSSRPEFQSGHSSQPGPNELNKSSNRPADSKPRGFAPQSSIVNQFGGPRQPPSYSPEEGYKY